MMEIKVTSSRFNSQFRLVTFNQILMTSHMCGAQTNDLKLIIILGLHHEHLCTCEARDRDNQITHSVLRYGEIFPNARKILKKPLRCLINMCAVH